jgi:hypothetical protein
VRLLSSNVSEFLLLVDTRVSSEQYVGDGHTTCFVTWVALRHCELHPLPRQDLTVHPPDVLWRAASLDVTL